MAKAAYGISKFQMGLAGAAGAMSAALADITQIVEDSVNVTFPDPDLTPITPEESDSPFLTLAKAGVKNIVLKSHNVDANDLPKFFGGAAVTASGTTTFTPGIAYQLPQQSIAFTTRPAMGVKQTWQFPLVDAFVSIDANPSKSGTLQLTFTFNVAQPYDGSGVAQPDFKVLQVAA